MDTTTTVMHCTSRKKGLFVIKPFPLHVTGKKETMRAIITILPTGDGQKRPIDNPLLCSRWSLDQPGSMDKPHIVCQTLMFEPPGAHSRITGMR